jgi:uncharacterized linocin/CFP29 family protein
MADILKRDFAPINPEAWNQIDDQAKRVLRTLLCARKVVDLSGPHGLEYGALDPGRLQLAGGEVDGVKWGVRQIMPLVETRVVFVLNRMELDNVSRGALDPNMEPLRHAAEQIALFEDRAIFNGFETAQIKGLLQASSQPPVNLAKDPEQYPQAVSVALKQLIMNGVEGPYTLVLGPDEYLALATYAKVYPLYKVIQEMIGGQILLCPGTSPGVLLSTRGGDFQLAVGQDLAVGYQRDCDQEIEFFLTESFTYRTIEPLAAVPFRPTP